MDIIDLTNGKLLKPTFKSQFKLLSENDQARVLATGGKTLSESLYKFLSNIASDPRCPCGNLLKFVSFGEGYRDYCSTSCKKKYNKPDCSKRDYAAIQKKIRATNRQRYGVENTWALAHPGKRSPEAERRKVEKWMAKKDQTLAKKRATNLERYGSTCSLHGQDIDQKVRETNLARYGSERAISSTIIMAKITETKMARYNDPTWTNRVQARNTYLELFGGTSPFSDPRTHEKARITCMKLYGVEYGMQNIDIRKRAFKTRGPSGPERKFAEMLLSRGLAFEPEFSVNGKCFDFAVFGKEGTLNTLVEIDGEYFHGLLADPDGHHVHGEKDCARFLAVPEGVKFLAIDSKNVERGISELCANFDVDYEDWIKGIVDACSSMPFPYPEYSDKRLNADWKKLKGKLDWRPTSSVGQSIVRRFHRSIWSARVGKAKSPVEAWSDRKLLEKCVRNRFIYSSSLSSHAIADGFNVCKIAPKVSVFRAALAKYAVEKYLSSFGEVFDPFSGFSGRMLGACAAGKKYVGQDGDADHVRESMEIARYLGIDAEVTVKDALKSRGTYECLFTCPPYSRKESWGVDGDAKSCDDWIDECLTRFDCKRYVFVVDKTEKYKDFVVEALVNKSHFGRNDEFIVAMDATN